jgi:hypothetical protein
MVVQAHRVAFSLGRRMQRASSLARNADRRSLATQNAKSTTRIANVVRVTNRARASMGGTLFSIGRSSLLSLPGVDPEWHGIVYEAPLYGARGALIFCNAMTNDQPSYIGTPAMEIAEMVFLHLAAA